jgi:predicted kinase
LNVVADSCNPIELTRREWEQVARDVPSDFINIEILCSDRREHRQRIERRKTDVPGLVLSSWKEIENREYHQWTVDRIVIDTAGKTLEESATELIARLRYEQS